MPRAILSLIYTRLLRWDNTRQVELMLALLSLGWCAQVFMYGSLFQQVLPICAVAGVLAVACSLQIAGLLAGWGHVRRWALFLEAIIWTSLFATILWLGTVSLTYFVFAFTSAWGYLVFSHTAYLPGSENQ